MAKQDNAKISKETKAKFKGKETWATSYEGHEITIVNKLKVTLYIDGVEAAKQKGIFASSVTLSANIPNTDKTVIAMIYPAKKSGVELLDCRFVIGDNKETAHGFTMKDGTFETLTAEEEKQYIQMKKTESDATTAAIIANL